MFSPETCHETRPGYEMPQGASLPYGVMILLCACRFWPSTVTFFAQRLFVDGTGKLSLSELPASCIQLSSLGSVHRSDDGHGFSQYGGFHRYCVTSVRSGRQPAWRVTRWLAHATLPASRNFLQKLLLILRLFPGVLLLISILYVSDAYRACSTRSLGVVDGRHRAASARLVPSSFATSSTGISPRTSKTPRWWTGCNRLTAFFQVIIHMVKPGIASISVFAFMSAWSNYLLFNTLILTGKVPDHGDVPAQS